MQHIKLNKSDEIMTELAEHNTDISKELAQGFVDSLYYQVKLTEKCCKMLAKQLEEKLEMEITLDELTALGTINLHNGQIHQRDLAQMLLKDRANTGRMLNVLESKDLIEKKEQTKNKRQANIITVTPKGHETLNRLTSVIKPMFDDVQRKMTIEEIGYIKNGLKKLRQIMKDTLEIHI